MAAICKEFWRRHGRRRKDRNILSWVALALGCPFCPPVRWNPATHFRPPEAQDCFALVFFCAVSFRLLGETDASDCLNKRLDPISGTVSDIAHDRSSVLLPKDVVGLRLEFVGVLQSDVKYASNCQADGKSLLNKTSPAASVGNETWQRVFFCMLSNDFLCLRRCC